ncbi:amidohydrolase family protein [Kordiimonas pumila]|uniref:Amidohydrolase family protein n=1 Tax=Kordiimonas pumila TaxID=2161677 RepID=A0ABV7D598_9PROT|nr:amidohydrolase family protein [Kordiimonas pumila]
MDAIRGSSIPFEVSLDEATWVSLDVSPDGEQVVFDILGDLYIMPIKGGAAKRLTNGPAYDGQPRFSPDGKRIVFVSDRSGTSNIWLIAPDGEGLQKLTEEADASFFSPEWSADGQDILVSRHDDLLFTNSSALYAYSIEGGEGVALVDKARSPLGAAPSPDGKWVYYTESSNTAKATIERYNLLTGETYTVADAYGGSVRPAVSPDGRFLAFGRRFDNQERMVLRDISSGAEQVLDVELDWDQQDNAFRDGDQLPGYSFLPDGSAIIYASHGKIRRYNLKNKDTRIIPFKATFTQTLHKAVHFKRKIEDGPVTPKLLRWTHEAPDGKTLFFSAAGKNYQYTLDTGKVTPVGEAYGLGYSPTVSPDGKWLAYTAWTDAGLGHIYKTSLVTKETVRLTQSAGLYENLAWSADNAKLVFLKSSGGEQRGEGNLEETLQKSICWISSDGGVAQHVITVQPRGDRRQAIRPVFNADATRVFFAETPVKRQSTYFNSVRLDGSDKQQYLEFRFADDVIPSPDGKWVVFTEHFETYLVPMPLAHSKPVYVSPERKGALPVIKLSKAGGYFVNWAENGNMITWSWGPEYFRLSLQDALLLGENAKPEMASISFTEPRVMGIGQVLLQGARIVTMGGAGVIEKGDILVENNRIKALGDTGTLEVPATAKVIDVTGKTIIPGLIDVHYHYRTSYNTEVFPENDWGYVAQLAYGVTTVRNPSARSQAVFTQAEMIEMGRTLGPRSYSTGEVMYYVRMPFSNPVKSLDDARIQVKRMKKLGATAVKQYSQRRREQRQWVLEAAREEGMNAVAEGASKVFMNMTLLMDGYTNLEHAVKTKVLYKDMRSLLTATGTSYTPTLIISTGGSAQDYFFQQSDVFRDEKLRRFTPYTVLADLGRNRTMRPEEDFYFKWLAKSTAEVFHEGGKVVMGAHGNLQGLGAHWEMWAMAMGGLTPLETLQASTINAAFALGLDSDIGSLEAGKYADLVILNQNPLADIRHTNTVSYVMKGGQMWEGATMNQVWPVQKKFSGFYWQTEGKVPSR